MQVINDKLIKIDEVLELLRIKKTKFYELIKALKNAYEKEQNLIKKEQNLIKKEKILYFYNLIKAKKFGGSSLWSQNQIQLLIDHIKKGDLEQIYEYIRIGSAA